MVGGVGGGGAGRGADVVVVRVDGVGLDAVGGAEGGRGGVVEGE